MLIWRGWGILGLLIPLFTGMVINETVSSYLGVHNYAMSSPWVYVAMLLPGALPFGFWAVGWSGGTHRSEF